MQIVIGGSGKVGASLCQELSHEGHDVTVIDISPSRVERIMEFYDVQTIVGSITSIDLQNEANVGNCDVFVAVTASDEVNITAAIIAKNLGAQHTIARVRDTEYASHIGFIRDSLGISYLVNPEYESARHLSEMLQFPAAFSVERFISGNIVMMEGELAENSNLVGQNLIAFRQTYPSIIVTAVAREEELVIPRGHFTLEAGDRIQATGLMKDLRHLYQQFALHTKRFSDILIVGGGRIAHYLLHFFSHSPVNITLIEKNEPRAEELAAEFPNISVLVGDGTDHATLDELNLEDFDLLVALTGMDEQNIMISLFGNYEGVPRVITKVNRTDILPLLSGFELQTTITPHLIACEGLMRYIRARGHGEESEIEALYRLMSNRIQAIEFNVPKDSKLLHRPIKDLEFKDESLIAFIFRKGRVIFPSGSDEFKPRDRVAIITKSLDVTCLEDAIIN